MHTYEYRHRVCFEETNIVGNVYYAHYVRWQGRCREMFLHDYAPELLQELKHGVTLATTRVSCAYYQELSLFDDVLIRMTSTAITPSRLTMHFQYFQISEHGEEQLVAEGEQEVACVRRSAGRVEPMPLPDALREAVEDYISR
ncbi:MAG TPA: thioesterase family protein [Candidatus Angelobacter sp.]|nr:thioesterase family protein [Candidatus Angelobacter sp.]